jgi:hypothetical protein
MTEEKAMNLKCPYSFDQELRDFHYCATDLCMSWDEAKGGCLRLLNSNCQCTGKKAAYDINRPAIGA